MLNKKPKDLTKDELLKEAMAILKYCLTPKDKLRSHQIDKWTPADLQENHEVLDRAAKFFREADLKRIKYLKTVLKARKVRHEAADALPEMEAA